MERGIFDVSSQHKETEKNRKTRKGKERHEII